MSDKYAYIDSSAFIKLIVAEPESAALQEHLSSRPLQVAATLLRTEVMRASARVSPAHLGVARQLLLDIAYIELGRPLIDQAGLLTPLQIRSLDAIHIAAAMSLGDDLDEVVSYDQRLIAAAMQWGLAVVSPR